MTDREEIRVPELGTPISHYTDAVRVGDLLFVSGCVPTDAEGNVVGGDDVAAQARKTFENIGAILAARGRDVRRRREGDCLPDGRRRPPEDQPRPSGVLRRHEAREHADRGQPARDPGNQDRGRGDRPRALALTGGRVRPWGRGPRG